MFSVYVPVRIAWCSTSAEIWVNFLTDMHAPFTDYTTLRLRRPEWRPLPRPNPTTRYIIIECDGMLACCAPSIQGDVLQIVGVETPQPGCQPSMLELKTSTMQIVRLPLAYTGNFEEVVDYNRLYTLGTAR